MGTWGVKSFENDTALDWLDELSESKGPKLIKEALEPSIDDAGLDSIDAEMAIAASEVVAAALGKRAAELPEDVTAWISKNPKVVFGVLVPKALAVLDAALADGSDLRELWEENAEDCPAWKASVRELRERLAKAAV
jgi:hypothetical protein